MKDCVMWAMCSVSDPYSLNPDPAKNLNPDPSYFLTLSVKVTKK